MPNMSYCRFRNTLNDLRDCGEHIDDVLPHEEHQARLALIEQMADILDYLGVTIEYSEVTAAKRATRCGEDG